MRALALLLLAAAGAAYATGAEELLKACEAYEARDRFSGGYCTGYIGGVLSSHSSAALDASVQWRRPYCIPDTVSSHQVRMIFTKYVRENPKLMHLPADEILTRSLTEAFPCRR